MQKCSEVLVRKELDTVIRLNLWNASNWATFNLSFWPKCSHRCVSLMRSSMKAVLFLKHVTKAATDASRYDNEMVQTYCDSNSSGAGVVAYSLLLRCSDTHFIRARKKQININIFGGTVSGTNGTCPRDKMGPVPGTKWDPSLGQTGLSLFNSTVKSPFCPVCPWDGWGFVPGTIVPQGPSEKCLCVLCLLVFFAPKSCVALRGFSLRGFGDVRRFPFCGGKRVWECLLRWGKGSKTPSFPRSEHEERGSDVSVSPSQEGISGPFSHRKRVNLVHPQIPLAKIPLAQRISMLTVSRRVLKCKQNSSQLNRKQRSSIASSKFPTIILNKISSKEVQVQAASFQL